MASADEVLTALEACVGKSSDDKKDALRALTALIDPTDESYEVQKDAAERVLPGILMQLLEDDDEGVTVAAASALAALSDHSGSVRDRVGSAHFGSTPEKVSLNPVQDDAGEMEGVFGVLLNMRFSTNDAAAAAGTDALAALTSLNRPNTLRLMHEIVKRLGQGEARALGALDDLLMGLDIRDDAAVLLDQALTPALSFLRNGGADEKLAAASLLAAIAEGRRGAATFLVAEGALPLATAMLTGGDLAARDTAAQLVWVLVKDDRKLLSPAKDALGTAGTKLVEPLLELVDKGDGETEAGEDGDGDDADGGARPEGAVAVDNGDSALLLLRALANQDEAVAKLLKGEEGLLANRSCAIM